jgi:hypothetical protein
MTYYRIFLLSFLTVSWIFLSGLNKPVENDTSVAETQKTEVELKSAETENTRKTLDTQPTTIKATDASVADENNPIKRNEFEKPLDLSVPFKDSENADLNNAQKSAAQSLVTNIFAPETKKKTRPLELNGGFLMSPEPEVEKRKSVDGAGIVINLKP